MDERIALLIEDDDLYRESFTRDLRKLNYQVFAPDKLTEVSSNINSYGRKAQIAIFDYSLGDWGTSLDMLIPDIKDKITESRVTGVNIAELISESTRGSILMHSLTSLPFISDLRIKNDKVDIYLMSALDPSEVKREIKDFANKLRIKIISKDLNFLRKSRDENRLK